MADLALLAKPAPEAPGQPLRKSEQQSNTSTVRLGELGDSHVHREASSHAGAIELSGNETSLLPSHSPDPSAPMTKTGSTTRTTSSTASEKLAEISEQVNRILAPVHALEALKFLDSSPKNFTPNLPVEASLNPQSVDLQMPSADSTPVRTGGRRGRGPRRRGEQLTPDTITLSSSIPGTLITPPSYGGRGQGGTRVRGARGGRSRGTGRGGKRRRSDAEVGTSDSEASENFTPLTQSRSGRKIIHATPSTPIIQIEDSTTKASPLSGKGSGSSGVRGSGKKRTSLPKTPGGARAVCKNCGRAHSPVSNAIVFCDGCNAGWHQFCHNPPIGKEIILIAEKAWFCSDCIVMKEERVRLQGKVPGQNLSMLEKRRYLQSLPSKELVSLLLHACSLHPDLPVFNQATHPDANTGMAEEYYEDEDLLPYPKAGNGVILRPEKERLNMLLDDDTGVFSHTTSMADIDRMVSMMDGFENAKLRRSGVIAA